MGSWEKPLDGLTEAEWRVLYARLDLQRAIDLYPGEEEPGASYRRAMEAAVAAVTDKKGN